MTQDDYLARIDQRLESLVSQIERLLQYIYADSTSTKAAVFGLGDYLQESNDRMARIEAAIEHQTGIAEQQAQAAKNQADAAKTQAENIRLMIEMVNRRQA
jgi:methyl-accepting chemotaxis protein